MVCLKTPRKRDQIAVRMTISGAADRNTFQQ